ncbi:MAG: restriction endonuclease subunit S [Spirochaetaceae bacterium]|jgi:predicted nucleotidyltransferase|nr:restriction endonuclease subunit S [Spirochaetaceae bacterium]
MICITEYEYSIILSILKNYVSDCEVRAFGSRYTWTNKDYSDLDIAVVGKKSLGIKRLGELCNAFEESELPFRMDVLDWYSLSKEFQTVIARGYEVIYAPGKAPLATKFPVQECKQVRLGDVGDIQTKKHVRNITVRATIPSINTTLLSQVIADLPPLAIQRSIVTILSCLDDKIELNNRINANLEAQAQAIFKSWFVDFEPFREGEFVDSDLGKIPKGWRVGTLGEISTITVGESLNGNSYNETGKGIVVYPRRTEFGWRHPTKRLYTTEPKRLAKKGDILLDVRSPVGDLNIAKEDCCIGRGLATINGENKSFLFYAMLHMKNQFSAFAGESTVFEYINKDDVHELKLVVPPDSIVKEYEILCNPMDITRYNLCNENLCISSTRDSLLPCLMSGEKV